MIPSATHRSERFWKQLVLPRQLTLAAVLAVASVVIVYGRHGAADAITPADDLSKLGAARDIQFWTPEQKSIGLRNMDKVFATRPIKRSGLVHELPVENTNIDWSKTTYRYKDKNYTIDEYMNQRKVQGLLVLKHGKIVLERYAYGNTPESKWTSWSVAKSMVSSLVGAAIKDGYINSVDDPLTKYLPALKGTAWERNTIKHLLQMSSGVKWDSSKPGIEIYDNRDSDFQKILIDNVAARSAETLFFEVARLPRINEPGKVQHYSTEETYLVGEVVRAATGKDVADYFSEKIWSKMGMDSDGYWLAVADCGHSFGGMCFSGTLRNYARLGLFHMAKGVLPDGTKVLPDGWMEEATSPSASSKEAQTPANSVWEDVRRYGYFWWLRGDGVYGAYGIMGQTISIDPAEDLIFVQHGAWATSGSEEDYGHEFAVKAAITTALKGR